MENFNTFISRVKRLAQGADINITTKREHILKAIYDSVDPISPNQIHDIALNRYKIYISKPTIYIMLRQFNELGILHTIYIPAKMTAYYSIKGFKSQNHLVCTKCGKIVTFFDNDLDRQLKKDSEKRDFLLTNHRVLLYGTCKDCIK